MFARNAGVSRNVYYDFKVTIVVEQRTKSLNDAVRPSRPAKCSGHNYIPVSNKWRIGVDLCLAEHEPRVDARDPCSICRFTLAGQRPRK